jgi:hypothetical protein
VINYSGFLGYFHLGAERKLEWPETVKRKEEAIIGLLEPVASLSLFL